MLCSQAKDSKTSNLQAGPQHIALALCTQAIFFAHCLAALLINKRLFAHYRFLLGQSKTLIW